MCLQKNIISIIALFSFCSLSLAGEETALPLEQVPADILQRASNLLPEARFKTANTEKEEDGTLVYEIQGVLADGRKVEVDILESGDIQEFEVEFHRDLVPGAVLKAIENKLPGFQIEYIEASHSKSKKVTQYEFVGTHGSKKLDIDVSADGRKIELADQ